MPPSTRSPYLLASIGAWSLALPARAQDPGPDASSSCVQCHAEEAGAEAGHPHAAARIECTTCHGGDAKAATKEAAKAEGTGYRGKLTGVEIVNVCGTCHSDVRAVSPFGLPTDQLAGFRTSKHGMALLEEESEIAPHCADCHGAHGILGPRNATSSVNPTNVPATCGRCHADEARMGPCGLDASTPAQWRASVHAKLLLETGDLSAPQCATCHDGHAAVPPNSRTVGDVCGRCHVREHELFAESPHGPLVEEGEFLGCTICHGIHEIQPALPEILAEKCALCHEDGDDAMVKRDAILADLRSSMELAAAAREELHRASEEGLVTEKDSLHFDDAMAAEKELHMLQHALDPARVAEAAEALRKDLEQLSTGFADERRERRVKRLSVVPVVLFLGLMSFGFWVRYLRIHRARVRLHGRAESAR